MSDSSLFSILGSMFCSSQPPLKNVVLELPLSDEKIELVKSANKAALRLRMVSEEDLGISGNPRFFAPYAIAVLNNPARRGYKVKEGGLYCDESGYFWAVDAAEEGASLVSFRKNHRVIVSSSELEDASNQSTFQVVLDPTTTLEKLFREDLVKVIHKALFGDQLTEGSRIFKQRMSYALDIVAETYRSMPRAPGLGHGGLFLLHVSGMYSTLIKLLAEYADKEDAEKFVTDSILPALSLPNPENGESFNDRYGAEVSKTIEVNWNSSSSIKRSIEMVRLGRNVESHPNPPLGLSIADWNWSGFDLFKKLEAHEDHFLAWHLINSDDPLRVHGYRSEANIAGLSEEEFFNPRPDAQSIDGRWVDGKSLLDRELSSTIWVIESVSFDRSQSAFISDYLEIYVPIAPGAKFTNDDLEKISFEFPEESSLELLIESQSVDIENSHLKICGRIVAQVCDDDRSYTPEVVFANISVPASLSQFILPTFPRGVLVLPASGSGYLAGKTLEYYGPIYFDTDGLPTDQESEYEFDLSVGEEINVVAWSANLPSAVLMRDPSERLLPLDSSRKTIRWVGTIVAQDSDVEIVEVSV